MMVRLDQSNRDVYERPWILSKQKGVFNNRFTLGHVLFFLTVPQAKLGLVCGGDTWGVPGVGMG
jgi:hypothetical protein